MEELGFPQQSPSPVMIDNQAVKKSIHSASNFRRLSHIHLRYHHIRALADAGDIVIHWIESRDQLADYFTKAQSKALFTPPLKWSQAGGPQGVGR